VKDSLREKDFMLKLDLKDVYFSIPLHQKLEEISEIYLGGQHIRISCPMFGLAQAPKIFSKLLKIPMSILRRLNIRLSIYIDDILIMAI